MRLVGEANIIYHVFFATGYSTAPKYLLYGFHTILIKTSIV